MPIEVPKNRSDKSGGQQPDKKMRSKPDEVRQTSFKPIKPIDRSGMVDDPVFEDGPQASDNIENSYLIGRQVAHEYHSPAVQSLKISHIPLDEQAMSAHGTPLERAVTQKKIEDSTKPLEEPWIDPTAAFSGGAGAGFKLSIAAGKKIMPSLGRALATGVVGGAADYPIGAATSELEEVAPGAALPFNIVAGMVSGVSLEKAVEDAVIKFAGKGLKSKNLKKTAGAIYEELLSGEPTSDIGKKVFAEFQKATEFAKSKLADETGAINIDKDNVFTEAATEAAEKADEKIRPQIPRSELFLDDTIDYMPALNIRSNPTGDVLLADNINLDRLESPQSIDQTIAKVATVFEDKIDVAKRGRVSNEETARLAQLSGVTLETLLKRRSGKTFNAHEALAARKILVSSAENLVRMARKVKSLDATDTDKFAFRKALNTHYAIQAQVSGMTAEAGRALQAFKIPAGSGEVQTKAVKDMLKNMPDGMSIDKMADMMSTFEFADQVGVFAKQIQRATTFDMFTEAWINGLLSGPQTHVVNSVSNAAVALWQLPERLVGAGISKLLGSTEGVAGGEVAYQAYGLIEGFKDGLKAFGRTVRTGEPSDEMAKIEARRYRAITAENVAQLPLIKKLSPNALQDGGFAANAVDFIGEGIRLPGRFLSAEDDFFKSIGYRMELRTRAYRTANHEGLKGDEFTKRVNAILSDPQTEAPDIHLSAVNASRYQTFTKPLGEAGQHIQGFFNKVPAAKLISPFIRTPANIMKFAGERTPLAWMSKNVRTDLMSGGARRDMAIAKMATGSMVMATASTLAAMGHFTGGGPYDPEEKATLRRQGWQPYSIKIGDKYVSYNRVEPLGMLFGVAADFAEISGLAGEELQPEMDKLGVAIVMAFSKNVTSKTWLQGVSNAIEAIEGPQRYGTQWLQGYARSVVPAVIAQSERTISPEIEAVYSMMDAMKARIPGFSKDLPPRRDFWGNPISTAIGGKRSWVEVASSVVNPFYISKGKESAIDKELMRIGMPLSRPQRTQSFEGVEIDLHPWEYDDFVVSMNDIRLGSTNKNLKDSLDYLVTNDKNYQMSDDGIKEILIRQKINEAKHMAKIALLQNHPILKKIIDQKKIERAMSLSNQ